MAAGTSFLPFSATLVFLLLLLSSTSIAVAVPISRSRKLMDEGSVGHHKDSAGNIQYLESWEIGRERMSLEVNDYPGSGANNRHTPRP